MAGGGKSHRLRRALCVFLVLLALVLVGTVIVLSTVVQYFGVDKRDILTEQDMVQAERWAQQAREQTESLQAQRVLAETNFDQQDWTTNQDQDFSQDNQDSTDLVGMSDDALDVDTEQSGDSDARAARRRRRAFTNEQDYNTLQAKQRIPKIIHQTWKTDSLPDRWKTVRQTCIDLHPDYEYMLWSDESSRDFIAKEYPWFLATFDGYTYPIQRADAIRYFVLHHYGGIYMDLDIGCRRNMDPLLYFQVILPATIPVGVSNDLMLAERGHPFMDLVIHNLVTFDHQYGTNYPTVMFSTGPMFLSAQYGLWPKEDVVGEERQVRVLPRRWYGKNAPENEMEDSYFDHYYGSSWHADDAGFITFLGKFGMVLMYLGFSIVILGVLRLLWSKRSFLRAKTHRTIGPISLPSNVSNLPFARPASPSDTEGLLDGSKSPGSRATTPGRGVLYYLPVWFFPPESGARTPMPTGTSQAGNWSQYFSNVSFVDDGSGTARYQPVPDFSRPPSPSNNSILHAPGAMHDGAFDGVQLHSIHGQQAFAPAHRVPQASSSPTSPNPPPAYSSLKSWGSQFFRSPRSAFLNLGYNSRPNSDDDEYDSSDDLERRGSRSSQHDPFASSRHSISSSHSITPTATRPGSTSALGFTLGRPRSPLPEYQARQSGRSTSPTTQIGRALGGPSNDVKHFSGGTSDVKINTANTGTGSAVRPVSMARSRSSESQSGSFSRRGSHTDGDLGRSSTQSISSNFPNSTGRTATSSSNFDDRRGSQHRINVSEGSGRDGSSRLDVFDNVVPGSPEGSVATTIDSFNTAQDTYQTDSFTDEDVDLDNNDDEARWLENGSIENEVDRLLSEMDPTGSRRKA